jgi:hypothetical protein
MSGGQGLGRDRVRQPGWGGPPEYCGPGLLKPPRSGALQPMVPAAAGCVAALADTAADLGKHPGTGGMRRRSFRAQIADFDRACPGEARRLFRAVLVLSRFPGGCDDPGMDVSADDLGGLLRVTVAAHRRVRASASRMTEGDCRGPSTIAPLARALHVEDARLEPAPMEGWQNVDARSEQFLVPVRLAIGTGRVGSRGKRARLSGSFSHWACRHQRR